MAEEQPPPDWNAVFEALEDGVCLLTTDMRIVWANQAFSMLVGQSREQLTGRSCVEVIDSLGRKALTTNDASVEGGEGQAVVNDLDRDSLQLRARVTPVRDETGRISRYVMLLRDISGIILHEREVARSQQLSRLGELAASIAHEIKNPLAGIQGAVDILIGRRVPGDPEREVLEGVRREVGRIDEIIHRLVSRARPHEARFRLTTLNNPVHRAVRLGRNYLTNLNRSDVRLHFEPDPDSTTLLIDELQIEDAVLNLVLNAADAIDGSGTIRVRVGHQEAEEGSDVPSAVIEIEDTGHGIASDQMKRIFNPFYTTSPHGTGLGLPTVRRIARLHGGTVEASSTLGQGSIFRIRIPIKT